VIGRHVSDPINLPTIALRVQLNFHNQINVICPVQISLQKYFPS
jgi:hypothetical protein